MSKLARESDRGFFVDTITGERLPEDACDANGQDPIGEDDEGWWWGTERAAWVLSPQHFTVEVWGYLGPHPWQGVFISTEAEAVDYAECHGITVLGWDSGRVS